MTWIITDDARDTHWTLAVVCLLVAGVLWTGGCGRAPSQVGIVLNEIGMTKTRVGPAPADLPTRQFASPSSLLRSKQADVVGDDRAEILVELEAGRGIEIRDQSGRSLGQIRTTEYLTDFGAVRASRPDKQDLIVYTYPNEARGGTFTVMTPDQREVARWNEYPPPARFAVGTWNRNAALFYLQDDALVVRSPGGQVLIRLAAPEGDTFRTVQAGTLAEGRTVVLASGDGYTPYHLVCVYEASGRLVFQEVANEHAFELEADGAPAFQVLTRSSRWRYTPSPAAR